MANYFQNLNPDHRPHSFSELIRWSITDRVTGKRRIAPPGPPASSVAPNTILICDPDGPNRMTWIGHSSFLITIDGISLVVDPVFSPRIGLFYPRHGRPGLLPDQMPKLDAVLITHNHYDHLDKASCEALGRHIPVIVPAGLDAWFTRRKHAAVTSLGWWESTEIAGLRVTAVPARHWSRRSYNDVNRSLWCGYVIESENTKVYHAGDTAWFDGFSQIAARHSDIDAALLPIGGYEPAWFMESNHLNPEQAGDAFLATKAKTMIPMHWGTFQMTDEPLLEPAERLSAWWKNATKPPDTQLQIPAVGETVILNSH